MHVGTRTNTDTKNAAAEKSNVEVSVLRRTLPSAGLAVRALLDSGINPYLFSPRLRLKLEDRYASLERRQYRTILRWSVLRAIRNRAK